MDTGVLIGPMAVGLTLAGAPEIVVEESGEVDRRLKFEKPTRRISSDRLERSVAR